MKLYIKQKVFSWGDKFTVKDASGEDRYYVEGEVFSWGKKLHVYDEYNREAGLALCYMKKALGNKSGTFNKALRKAEKGDC